MPLPTSKTTTKTRLSILLVQLKHGNTCENLPNGIRQIVYSMYSEKQVSKEVYNISLQSI